MKPSKINVLKAKKALFLFPGFRALTWKGVAYCKSKYDITDYHKGTVLTELAVCLIYDITDEGICYSIPYSHDH